jgi:hypothetical protein
MLPRRGRVNRRLGVRLESGLPAGRGRRRRNSRLKHSKHFGPARDMRLLHGAPNPIPSQSNTGRGEMRRDEQAKERFRIEAGMGGIVAVTLLLLMAQLQIDSAGLFFA